jgi:N-acyl-phosphatidylethanolamine-hydrolysing phospholipase D
MPNRRPYLYICFILAIGFVMWKSIQHFKYSSFEKSPNWRKGAFQNVYERPRPNLGDFLSWRWNRRNKDIRPAESYNFQLVPGDAAFLKSNKVKTTLTWIGHATVLLQHNGKNILTDPQFSERASPVQWAGPKRVVRPGLTIDDLPPIDVVVISHDHYDSLDTDTITKLYQREGGKQTTFMGGLGLKSWFRSLGIERAIELDWWNKFQIDDWEVIAVPVHHWSQRTPLSRNMTLWAGWVVSFPDFRFFFAGDSGYTPIFKDIGQKLGPFDLSAIPIGAYEPRWFMKHHHIIPEEAVRVHLDSKSKKSVAIHWGTFILTDEPLDEPPKRLSKSLEKENVDQDAFVVLRHGETIVLHDDRTWRSLQGQEKAIVTK